MRSPCLGCEERTPTCHSADECRRGYPEWAMEERTRKQKDKPFFEAIAVHKDSFIWKNGKKMRRR